MKKRMLKIAGLFMALSLVSAGAAMTVSAEGETLVYGSGDYTRINPAMDEHGEINILIFNGLTGHDGDNQVVPALAESWEFDEETNTYIGYAVRSGALSSCPTASQSAVALSEPEPFCRGKSQ